LSEATDQESVVLAKLPAGPRERRIALVIGLVLLAIGVVTVPFGTAHHQASNTPSAIQFSLAFLADLITWFLLISQFRIVRSRALLVLASGYLFISVMNISEILTMWGQFSPTGLLNAGRQTGLWLALAAYSGFPLAVFFYSVMKKEPRPLAAQSSTRSAIAASVAIVIAIVLALTWVAIAGESHLPRIVPADGQPYTKLQDVGAILILFAAATVVLLWSRRRSVLDLWLLVAMCACLAEGITKWLNTSFRFGLPFYVGNALFIISSTALLIVLLKETMTLYGRLAVALVALRRLSAEKLQRSEAYLTEAQQLSHTGSFGRSLFNDEIYWSDETYRIFELDRSAQPSLEAIIQRIHPEDRDQVRKTIDRATQERTGFDIEYRFLKPDDSVKYLHVVARTLESSPGNFEFVGAVTDVTERIQAEDALRQAQAELARANRVTTMGELAASLAHEVSQPISAAVTNASTCLRWLEHDEPDLEEVRAAAKRILKDGKLAGEIIRRTRAQFEKGASKRELTDVNEIIQETIALLSREAMRYNISIRTELAADLPALIGDRVQLQQVAMNLIVNSIDAMKDVDRAREMNIKSRRVEGDQILVSVSDSGIGLPPEQAEQIFKAFFTTKPHGTGMGLRISRSIIESHGGRLWADGAPGCGATFHFSLPATVAACE
jgi:signal transduction histidine kinase